MMVMTNEDVSQHHEKTEQLVTVIVEGQLLGFPISRVHDVFELQNLSIVPRSSDVVAGLINLRGRVVTMLSLRVMLGFSRSDIQDGAMAIGVEWKDESVGLIVDEVGEVIEVNTAAREKNPANLDPRWGPFCAGIHKLENKLLVELDLNALLNHSVKQAA